MIKPENMQNIEELSSRQVTNPTTEVTTSDSIMALLNSLFPEQQREDKEVRQVKEILGNLVDRFDIEEMQVMISEIQYITTIWLDGYEKDILGGKTLKDILNDG